MQYRLNVIILIHYAKFINVMMNYMYWWKNGIAETIQIFYPGEITLYHNHDY